MHINSIFFSIQGEGKLTGVPCMFVRLHGCNLCCKWCDESYTRSKNIMFEQSPKDIFSQIKDNNYVCITGGEPLLQKEELIELCKLLIKKHIIVSIETNGTISLDNIPSEVTISADLKTPSSNCNSNFDVLSKLKPTDEIKAVCKNKIDTDFAFDQFNKLRVSGYKGQFIFSLTPSYSGDQTKYIIHNFNHKNWKVQVQLHKVLGVI